jgi:hypothetical protein
MMATTFEALSSNFHGEVKRIAGLLDLSIEASQIDKIEAETDLASLRQKYKDTPSHRTSQFDFFRKGEVGDWQNHFDDEILSDHDRICREGLSALDSHTLIVRAKRKIRRIFT